MFFQRKIFSYALNEIKPMHKIQPRPFVASSIQQKCVGTYCSSDSNCKNTQITQTREHKQSFTEYVKRWLYVMRDPT